jgi:hypothetical protein
MLIISFLIAKLVTFNVYIRNQVIMNRALHRIVLLALFTLLVDVTFSQSLYWVGGSGNFNDPKHWSNRSGGEPAFLIPDNTIDVYFDDNSGSGQFTVNFDKNNSVKSFNANILNQVVVFEGSKLNVVYISEGIYLSHRVKFNSQAEMIFSSASLSTNLIEFGLSKLYCNLYFNHGNYIFRSIDQNDQYSVSFGDGNYIFNKMFMNTGRFVSSNPGAKFNFNESYFKASNSFMIDNNSTVVSNKLYISTDKSPQKFSVPSQVLAAPNNTFSNIMAICSLTVSTIPACAGPCTGVLTISFSPSCTDNPYNISVSNGDPTCAATTASLAGTINTATSSVYTRTGACACAANYQILIFDNLGNPFFQNVNFNPNTATATNNNTLTTCSYLCDGKMSGIIFGSFPYTVAITPNTVTPASFTTNLGYTLTNLCGGVTYTFTITDKDGCIASIPKAFGATPPILANAATQSLLCNSVCNGSVVVNPTGGAPGYTVHFNTGPTFTVAAAGSASITGLCQGAYSSTITDTKGCTLTTNYNIAQPPPITVTPTQTNLACNAVCNGVAQVSVTGGTPPYFYTWSPSASTASNASGLCAGTQTVSILDNNACPKTQAFTITSPPAITVNVSGTNVTCNLLCNGSATATASGGVGPHTYTWTGPAFGPVNTAIISGLCPGTYTLVTRDANLCTDTKTITIIQPPPSTLNVNVVNNTCFSSCAGAATISLSGGNGAPFSYTVAPAGTSSAVAGGVLTLSNLCFGNFTISATDASLCPSSTVITITQPTSITPNITTQTVNCNGACTGSINSAPVGGSGGPYTFTLFTPAPSSIVGPPPYTNLCAGIYTLAIKDATNCVSNTTINIAQPPALVPSIVAASVTCFNACNGSLAGSVIGGTPGYTLVWTTPTGTVAGGNLTNQCAGNYTFSVTDAKSCTAQTTFTLLQPADITATFNVTNPSCNTSCNGQISTILAGGTPGYTLNWSNSGGNPNINLCNGVYTLTVNDTKNCIKIFTAAVVAPPAFTISVVTNQQCARGIAMDRQL